MKKVVMSLLVMALSVTGVFAQRNTVLVYGTVGATSHKQVNGTKTNTFNFSPAVGYQFNDNWTAGLTLSTESANTRTSLGESKSSAFGVGPFIRYAVPLSDIFALYGQFNADVLSGKAGDVKTNGFRGTFFPAIGVNMKNGFALNFSFGGLSFASQKVKGASEKTTDFNLNLGSGASFGISKNF
ncbi:outer membrane protein with beta-barrel domain [Larkinella arboricola]|uniref:Outer membrane protein with beta-barrel domain n=1 Tax=Larkinella arboricola TaxID=643671 RepID=A0A327WSB6_LARAB|nr:outer membrane beta-barrel protein [Larkinella arboricola]RAJ94573.1 outer membrane protein with beta-barrel domain [Larkinella arboricola]